MKVLLANKFFYPRGGDAAVFFATAMLLKEHGHDVSFFSMKSADNLECPYSRHFVSYVDFNGKGGILQRVRAAARVLYSFEARQKIAQLINEERPTLAHLHNIYHQLSPSIIDALKKRGIPTVMTLHDYKLICAAYTLLSDAGICERCGHGAYHNAIKNACIKGSKAKSMLGALEMYLHHRVLKPYEKVDVFISPSRFLKQKTEEMGFKGKVVHLPNFINPSDYEPCFDSRNGTIVYFGRLSREKGLRTLIDAVKGLDISLKVIGTGPEKQNLEAKVVAERIANVSFLGYKTGRELHREIANSGFAVVPSEWYENNPRAIIEAFALGKPVLGANIGGIPELVRSGETGLTFESGNANDLRERILHLMKDKSALSRMGRAARCFVEKELNPRSHYERLMQIYKMAGA